MTIDFMSMPGQLTPSLDDLLGYECVLGGYNKPLFHKLIGITALEPTCHTQIGRLPDLGVPGLGLLPEEFEGTGVLCLDPPGRNHQVSV